MATRNPLFNAFKTNAELAAATVSQIDTLAQATEYVAARANEKSNGAGIIAAPGWSDTQLNELQGKIPEATIIRKDFHTYSNGFSFAITCAEFGIADTGTLVFNSNEMDKRLATMIADVHIAILPASKIAATAADLIPELNRLLSEAAGYLAFVTGPSRTADIERVLVVGVHGPLELHILVIKDG